MFRFISLLFLLGICSFCVKADMKKSVFLTGKCNDNSSFWISIGDANRDGKWDGFSGMNCKQVTSVFEIEDKQDLSNGKISSSTKIEIISGELSNDKPFVLKFSDSLNLPIALLVRDSLNKKPILKDANISKVNDDDEDLIRKYKKLMIGRGFDINKVIPNPVTKKKFTIDFTVNYNIELEISIYDMNGNEVKKYETKSYTRNSYSKDYDVTDLSSGMYLLVLKAGDDKGTVNLSIVN